jgi:hypothetical protein
MSDTLLMLFSYQPSEGACALDELPLLNWRRFAAKTFASAVAKGSEKGPFLVSCWLAMRAAEKGWMDDFDRWGKKAHELGVIDKELLESPLFKTASVKLIKEERLHASSRRFRLEYEESFGYPVSKNPAWVGEL